MQPFDHKVGHFITSRRTFIQALTASAGLRWLRNGLPLDLLDSWTADPLIPGKSSKLVVLGDRPLNLETPPHLLDSETIPGEYFFVRNNGIPPEPNELVSDRWTLTIDGEAVEKKLVLTVSDLKKKFQTISKHILLECAGNGRKEYQPPAKGNQWTLGGVGCAKWTGVRLKDVLLAAGVKSNAKYIGYYGADKHLNGKPGEIPISRGVPISKALEDDHLIAWAMNDQEIPIHNGRPLRLVIGGWPASCSGKWLTRIAIRDKEHDGPKMKGHSYRVPCKPVEPGAEVAEKDMCIIESMPVKSLITYPQTGGLLGVGKKLQIRGHAWAGDLSVKEVWWSIDFGETWHPAQLSLPVNRFAWQRFTALVSFPRTGYYEVWARAHDELGRAQPMVLPSWNPEGYLNNSCHRIAVKIV